MRLSLSFPTFLGVCCTFLLAGADLFARDGHWGEFSTVRHDGTYLEEIRPERCSTPHLPFARPLAGGPLRVLFIIPNNSAPDVTELRQRLDVTFAALTTADGTRLADDFPLTTAVLGQGTPEEERKLDRLLDGRYDVICLARFAFDSLPPKAQLKVLSAVRNGTGLLGVFAAGAPKPPFFAPLAPPVPATDILRGCSLAGLPYFNLSATNPADKAARQLLTTGTYGKGRVAWLNYTAPHELAGWYIGDCFSRPAVPPSLGEAVTADMVDAALALTVRTLLWTAKRDQPAIQLNLGLADGATVTQAEWNGVSGMLRTPPEAKPATIDVTVFAVRPDGSYKANASATVKTVPGQDVAFTCPIAPPPGGPVFLWAIAHSANESHAVQDWAVTTVTIQAARRIAAVALAKSVIAPGETITATVTLDGAPAPADRLVVDAKDVYDRVFWTAEQAASTSATFTVPTTAACGRQATVRVALKQGADTLSANQAEFFIRRTSDLDFINLIWGHSGIGQRDYQPRGWLNDSMARQLRAAGFNTGMIFSANGYDDVVKSSMALSRTDAQWMIYCAHVTTDRIRSWANPDERRKQEEALRTMAEKARPFGPLVYNLGDENGLYGAAPHELSPHEKTRFTDYLRRQYDNRIAELNRAWQTTFADFPEATPVPVSDAKAAIPRRADLQGFWEWMYADTYHWMRAAIRQGDPAAQVGAEGSEGCNLELTISQLDWWAPYTDRYANAQLRFWVPQNSMRGNWWGAYSCDHGGRGKTPFLWDQLAAAAVNSSMFFVAGIGSECMMAVDGGYADFFERWRPHMEEIVGTTGPLIRASPPVDDGLGIFWSRTAELASTFDPRGDNMRAAHDTVLDLCDGLGLNAKFVSEQQILDGKLKPATTPILFLTATKAVTDKLALALSEYLRSGGVVIADILPDVRNEHLADVPPGRLLGLFGAKSGSNPDLKKQTIQVSSATVAGRTLSLSAPACATDAGVSVTDGTAAAKAGTTPLFIWKQHGKGVALLLNVSLHQALLTAQNPTSDVTPGADFLLSLLRFANVRPALPPEKGLPWTTVRRFQHGDGSVIGLTGWRGPTSEKRFCARPQDQIRPLRSGCGALATGELRLPADAPDAIILSVLPPTPRKLALDGPRRVQAGDTAAMQVGLTVGGKPVANSLLRLDVIGPDGKPLPAHRQFIRSAGKPVAAAWPVALNAAPGTYRVVATELISGTTGESKMTVNGATVSAAADSATLPPAVARPTSSPEAFGVPADSERIWACREWEDFPYTDPAAGGKNKSGERWPIVTERADAMRAGLRHRSAMVYAFPERRLSLTVEQTYDPKTGLPVSKGYGDNFFRFGSVARWGWSFEHFLSPEIAAKGADKSAPRTQIGLLRDLSVLEAGGDRVMADFVFPLLVDGTETGQFVLRCVIRAGEPQWLYARCLLAGNPDLAFKSIQLSSFGGAAGAVPPGGTQWIAGLTQAQAAPAPGTVLPLNEYAFFAAFKRGYPKWLEEGGSAGVFLPEHLTELRFADSGSVRLMPGTANRSALFALAEFTGATTEVLPELRRDTAVRQQRLRDLDWRPDWARELGKLEQEVGRLETLASGEAPELRPWRADLSGIRTAIAAGAPAADSAELLRLGQQLQKLRDDLQAAWKPAATTVRKPAQ